MVGRGEARNNHGCGQGAALLMPPSTPDPTPHAHTRARARSRPHKQPRSLTLRSPLRWWMPTTWPSYTCSPGVTNSRPRCWHDSTAYAVTCPVSWHVSDPFSLGKTGRWAGGRVGS